MKKFHSVAPNGLTEIEVLESLKKYGANVEKTRDFTTIKLILKTVFSVFNILMATLIVVLLLINERTIAQFIGIIAAINTIIEAVQEFRARLVIKKLNKLSEKTTKVIRDKKILEIPVKDLVIGDVIFLSTGDRVPVDGSVISNEYAEFDESILSGESKYIEKKEGSEIKAGSFLAAGSCYYKMTKFTKDSYLESMTKEIAIHGITESPLQSQINQIIKVLTYMTIFLIAILAIEGFVRQKEKEEIIVNAAALVSSLVPQGLVLITTLSFTYGAIKIAKYQAVVQKLSAIESMANTKIICIDKTGTLTKNILEVKEIKLIE